MSMTNSLNNLNLSGYLKVFSQLLMKWTTKDWRKEAGRAQPTYFKTAQQGGSEDNPSPNSLPSDIKWVITSFIPPVSSVRELPFVCFHVNVSIRSYSRLCRIQYSIVRDCVHLVNVIWHNVSVSFGPMTMFHHQQLWFILNRLWIFRRIGCGFD